MQKNSRDMGEISTHGTHWNLRHVHCTEKKLKCALGFKHHKLCTIFQVFWHQLCVWNRLKANMLKVNKTGILSAKMALILACSLKNATECFNRFFLWCFCHHGAWLRQSSKEWPGNSSSKKKKKVMFYVPWEKRSWWYIMIQVQF